MLAIALCSVLCGLAWWFLSCFQDAFLDAVYGGDREKVERLLKTGENPNKRDSFGNNPLTLAGFANQSEIAELLIAHGACLTIQDNQGMTPLHCAAYNGNIDVARVFIAHGAPINATNEFGHTPLSEAVAKGPPAMVELLLAHGADVHHRDARGWQPIHIAVRAGGLESAERCAIVAALLDHGADPNASNPGGCLKDSDSCLGSRSRRNPNKGETPLVIAESNGFTEIAELLKNHGATTEKSEPPDGGDARDDRTTDHVD